MTQFSHMIAVKGDRWREARDWLKERGLETHMREGFPVERNYSILPNSDRDEDRIFIFYGDEHVTYFKLAFS